MSLCRVRLSTLSISIHALRGEGDDVIAETLVSLGLNFNPRPPWGGRRKRSRPRSKRPTISIHALRGEGDKRINQNRTHYGNISIHALRGEGDELKKLDSWEVTAFQSTPSVGRATSNQARIENYRNISIHALRGEGDYARNSITYALSGISIHALRGEGDFSFCFAYS